MADNMNTARGAGFQCITPAQLSVLKGLVRVGAESNPAGTDKGRFCSEITRFVCDEFCVRRLADIPASEFPIAMHVTRERIAKAVRVAGPAETAIEEAQVHLDAAFSGLQQAKHGVACFRRAAEHALAAPLAEMFGASEMGNRAQAVRDAFEFLFAEPLLLITQQILLAHSTLNEAKHRLPFIGKLLDAQGNASAPKYSMAEAD